MSAKRAEKTSLEIKRFLNVPRNRVYEAWTDPVQLRQWFGPESVRTRDLVAETRVGGKFRWDLTNPEGEEMTVQGEYRDLQPGRKIVFTWQWQDDETWENHNSLVTVELFDTVGGNSVYCTNTCRAKSRATITTTAGRVCSTNWTNSLTRKHQVKGD